MGIERFVFRFNRHGTVMFSQNFDISHGGMSNGRRFHDVFSKGPSRLHVEPRPHDRLTLGNRLATLLPYAQGSLTPAS